jgi:hypothetical protein
MRKNSRMRKNRWMRKSRWMRKNRWMRKSRWMRKGRWMRKSRWMKENREMSQDERRREMSKIATLPYPTDPSHVSAFKIKGNEYISMRCSRGPCQPDIPYPKNTEGRSFQKQWFSGNV